MNAINPFFTSEVNEACDDARVLYLDTLARMQLGGGQPVDWLERMQQQSQRSLDQYWDAAFSLALADHVQGVSDQLAVIVKEWGLYRAFSDLIDADAEGRYLDPADPDTYDDIQRAIGHKVVYLTTELLNEWLRGDQLRQADQFKQQHDWQNTAYQQVQQNMQHQTAWQEVAFQMLQEQRTSWQTGHKVAQDWSGVALRGAQQAQEGVQHMYDFVVSTQSNVVGMTSAIQHHLEQNLPDSMREAVREEARSRRRGRLTIILFGLAGVAALYVLAYFLVTHLY